MSFLKDDAGNWKTLNIAGTLILLGIVVLSIILAATVKPKPAEVQKEVYYPYPVNVTYTTNEYVTNTYKVGLDNALPVDARGCAFFQYTQGNAKTSYALLCPNEG